ncbi:hypothetical protein HOY82DRAFT_538258 [Tuber indicum]|nr:hypothetical protein HOY82DRAFT_538258 [Tuber indicum]
MSRPAEFIFAASVSSLDEQFPEILAPRFTGPTIPPAHTVTPFDVCTEYEAVDFYSRIPLNLGKTKPLEGFSALKTTCTTWSFHATVKELKRPKARKLQRKRPQSPEPPQCKYNIVRYEFRPKLPFVLKRRLWYPVEQAWQIYNYDKHYLSPVQVERLESLKRERDFALAMIRGGHPSYWKMVRNAEMGMFGDSPEFGVRPKNGRATPLLGRGRSELHSYKSNRGMPWHLEAVDGFNPKKQKADWKVSVKSVEATFNPYVYGATLDQIIEEETSECASIATGIRTTMRRPIRRWGVALTQPKNPPVPQSLVTTMQEHLGLSLPFGESKKRQSMDSGFAESRSMYSSEVLMGTRGPIETDPNVTRAHAKPRYIPRHSFHQVPTLPSPNNDGAHAPHYDLAPKRVQSAVDNAARIRRIRIGSLKRVCRARRTKTTTAIFPVDVDEYEIGAPLFKPWTIGDQSVATYHNPSK